MFVQAGTGEAHIRAVAVVIRNGLTYARVAIIMIDSVR